MRDPLFSSLAAGILAGILAGSLAGCSAGNYLSTGSVATTQGQAAGQAPNGALQPGATPQTASAQVPAGRPKPTSTPTDRALHAGATVARAQHCGFYFDPAQLRAAYLASESQSGLSAADLAKLSQVYDFTHKKVTKAVAAKDGYCSDFKTKQIKAALTKQLAGDFNPPPPKKVVGGGWFDFGAAPRSRDKLDTEEVFKESEEIAGR